MDVVGRLENQWERMSRIYLPAATDGPWRYSASSGTGHATLARQGWKIHVSANVTNATTLLGRAGPLCLKAKVPFKGPRSLAMLAQINSGTTLGFSQVGKCITVYPRDEREALEVASALVEATRGMVGPRVPYDERLTHDAPVYYRYGLHYDNADINGYLQRPDGTMVKDRRRPGAAVPDWVADPFRGGWNPAPDFASPLQSELLVYDVLRQRGKGGVYEAVDLTCRPARRVLLKEGRLNGETDWLNIDGRASLMNEWIALGELASKGVEVPARHRLFEVDGNRYLCMERIEGKSLATVLMEASSSTPRRLAIGRQVTSAVRDIHACGWLWRDCKPDNFVVDDLGRVRPIDFEGACLNTGEERTRWGSPLYSPDRSDQRQFHVPTVADDLFALGVTLRQVLTDTFLDVDLTTPIAELSPWLSPAFAGDLDELLSTHPERRPSADQVLRSWRARLLNLAPSRSPLRLD